MPKSLDETYKRILNEVNNENWKLTYRLLQCLTVALRPLRVEELAEVLAFDLTAGRIPKLNAGWRWEDEEEAVLSACSSLVSVIVEWLPDCSILAFLRKRIPYLESPCKPRHGRRIPVSYSHRTFTCDPSPGLSRRLTLPGRPLLQTQCREDPSLSICF